MTPQQFTNGWRSAHVNSKEEDGEVHWLAEHLFADAGNTGFDRKMLSKATGGTLVQFAIKLRQAVDAEISSFPAVYAYSRK